MINTVFVTKMLKAKKLEYEAIKEILPPKMKEQADKCEQSIMSAVKDIAFDMMRHSNNTDTDEDKKATKKVNIDFN